MHADSNNNSCNWSNSSSNNNYVANPHSCCTWRQTAVHSPWTRQEPRPGQLGPTVDSACFTTPFVRSSCSLRRGKLQQDAGRQKGVHGSRCSAFATAAVPRPTSIHCTFSMPLLSDLWPEKSTPIDTTVYSTLAAN